MKCARAGCEAEAISGSNFCGGHQPRDTDVIAKSFRTSDSGETRRDDSKDEDRSRRGGAKSR